MSKRVLLNHQKQCPTKTLELRAIELAIVLDGKTLAQDTLVQLKQSVAQLYSDSDQTFIPRLAVVLVGDDPASHLYVKNKQRHAKEIGIDTVCHRVDAMITQEELIAFIETLNDDKDIHGILVQLPVPKHIDAQRVIRAIRPDKDVDGLHPHNVGLLAWGNPTFIAATPQGVMRLLEFADCPFEGARAVVVGRSILVGLPMTLLLGAHNATVTLCHSYTSNLPEIIAQADIVVTAVGQPEIIQGHWIKQGAYVIDVGISRQPNGHLIGDVAFEEASTHAQVITSVIGGVGPMTVACMLENTVKAATAFYEKL